MRVRLLLIFSVALALASAIALNVLNSTQTIPSIIREPLSYFAGPGVTVWWLVLGGPFQVAPRTLGGMGFAAVANALCWLFVALLTFWLLKALRRIAA